MRRPSLGSALVLLALAGASALSGCASTGTDAGEGPPAGGEPAVDASDDGEPGTADAADAHEGHDASDAHEAGDGEADADADATPDGGSDAAEDGGDAGADADADADADVAADADADANADAGDADADADAPLDAAGDGEAGSAGDGCVATTETCNGVDDDCDGEVDEGGDALCDASGPACVVATCGGAKGCQTAIELGTCLIGGACVPGGTIDAANPCRACDPATSATAWTPRVGAACDDAEPCTTGETCGADGTCGGGGATDCSAFGVAPCSSGVCLPGVGCSTKLHDGAACDDGKFCTVGETCVGGTCGVGAGAGSPRDCAALDALPCTTGVCDEVQDACVHQRNVGATCDDGDKCSTASACDGAGNCVVKAWKDCSAQTNACNLGVCDPETGGCGVQPANQGKSCDDGDACTGNGTCSQSGGSGYCAAGTPTPDVFESNDSAGSARSVSNIDDCGNNGGALTATINPGTDVDWYVFNLNNTSSFCDYGTTVKMTPPGGRDYDLTVCVRQSGSFSASCATGASVGAPSGLSGYSCCANPTGGNVTENVKINWSCSGTFCSDGTGTVVMVVRPHGGQPAECSVGYSLSWVDD